jgi:hypothetical protein
VTDTARLAWSATVVRDSFWVAVWAGLPASVAWTVKVAVPAFFGVPEMVPLLLRASPAGRDPAVTFQV